MRGRKSWCALCRENFEEGDDFVKCVECKKKAHTECLINENLIDNEQLRNPGNYVCYQCANVESEVPENEDRCKVCRDQLSDIPLLLCDGCTNSYHLSCVGLQTLPNVGKWFCPECKPEDHNNLDVRRMRKGFVIENMNGEHVNSSTCYVCQRPGKLLGCDFCPNSFHPTCLPDLDFDNIKDQWECPCCKNEDPLLNQGHKRWSKKEIIEIMKKRQKDLSFWRAKITKYRNRFLLAHRKDLLPFVNPKVLANLTKTFKSDFYAAKQTLNKKKSISNNGNANQGNNNNNVFMNNNMSNGSFGNYDKSFTKNELDIIDSKEFDDYINSLEDEANEKANQFIESVFLSVYHANGKKIERRPLVDSVQLKPHQEDGVEWLLKSFLTGGAILADEMGLGKTIQTLCFLSYLKCNKIDGPHLIVVPLSTVGNWLREIHRFTPHLTCIKICGSKNERTHAMEDRLAEKGLYDLYVTTYETVKNEEEFFVDRIPKWQCIVLDEAHRIKNQSGAIRHSMDRVVGNMRLLLTGTPLQNNSAELFTLINFMFPDIFKNSEIIEQAFMNTSGGGTGGAGSSPTNSQKNRNGQKGNATAGAGGNAGIKEEKEETMGTSGMKSNVDIGNIDLKSSISQEDLKAIRCLLDKIMLRRLKEQAITLPRKIFHDVWLPLGPLSAHWYKMLLDIRSMVEEKVSMKKLLGLVIKMRIICGHPKGIVSRPSQMERLFAFFEEESEEVKERVKTAAMTLKNIAGEEHIMASSKLLFVDKLLCQLHYENCKYVKNYLYNFEKHKKEVAAYKYHKIQEQNNIHKKKKDGVIKFKKIGALESCPLFNELYKQGSFELKPTSEKEDLLKSFMDVVSIDLNCPYRKKRCIYDKVKERFKNANNRAGVNYFNNDTYTFDDTFNQTLDPHEDDGNKSNRQSNANETEEEEFVNEGGISQVEDMDDEGNNKKKINTVQQNSDAEYKEEGGGGESSNPKKRKNKSLNETIDKCTFKKKSKNSNGSTGIDMADEEESDEKEERENEANDEVKQEQQVTVKKEEATITMKSVHNVKDAKDLLDKTDKTKRSDIRMHKVLIFTQFQLVLDELEEYCKYRCWKYMRLDGSTNKLIRELDIREFNMSNSMYFIYLISTRAGGLGINLTAANHVIMYDEDWNPFIDLQAIDRAHRIGQKREVNVWKLMTEWTVEERMAFRREQKLKLDKLVVQTHYDEDLFENFEEKLSSDEIRKLMLHGKAAIQNMSITNNADQALDKIIERGRKELPIINGVDLEKVEKSAIEEEILNQHLGGSNDVIKGKQEEEEEIKIKLEDGGVDNDINIDEVMMDEAEEPEMLHKNTNMNDCSPTYMEGETFDFTMMTSKSKSSMLHKSESCINEGTMEGRGSIMSSTNNSSTAGVGRSSGNLSAGGGDSTLWRSGRERKKPQNLYTPEYWGKKQEVKHIKHELRCFICNNTKNYKTVVKDRNGKEVEIDYGDMINCFRCPKSYHKLCEGIKDEHVKRTWTCSWHECCLCFRKSSQCGNLLIHCATCPTSFCYNCFPPDYTRYYVGEEYYHNLRQRGVNFTPQNWVCFLCSKCKAVEEQKRRRKMTKEERENEKQLQKELRSQLQDSKQEEMEAKRRKKAQQIERDKFIVENRKRIDAMDHEYEMNLREAYGGLFPALFVQELLKRIENAKLSKRVSGGGSAGGGGEEENSAKEGVLKDDMKKDEKEEKEEGKEGVGKETNKKKSTAFLHTKTPSKLLALCENCKLPCHANFKYPGKCCFPLELDKSYFIANNSFAQVNKEHSEKKDKGTSAGEETDIKSGLNEGSGEGSSKKKEVKEEVKEVKDELKEDKDEGTLTDAVTVDKEIREDTQNEEEGKIEKKEMLSSENIIPNENGSNDVNASSTNTPQNMNDQFSSSPNSKGKTRKFLRAACSKCGTVQLGKLAHFRKHCDKLTEEEKKEYDERREKLKSLIVLLKTKHMEDECTEEEYRNLSVFKFKYYYTQFQEKADDILEECIREIQWNIIISDKKKIVKKEKELKKSNTSSKHDVDKEGEHGSKSQKGSGSNTKDPSVIVINSDESDSKEGGEGKTEITDEEKVVPLKRKKTSGKHESSKKKKTGDTNEKSIGAALFNNNTKENPYHQQLLKDTQNENFLIESLDGVFAVRAKEFVQNVKGKEMSSCKSDTNLRDQYETVSTNNMKNDFISDYTSYNMNEDGTDEDKYLQRLNNSKNVQNCVQYTNTESGKSYDINISNGFNGIIPQDLAQWVTKQPNKNMNEDTEDAFINAPHAMTTDGTAIRTMKEEVYNTFQQKILKKEEELMKYADEKEKREKNESTEIISGGRSAPEMIVLDDSNDSVTNNNKHNNDNNINNNTNNNNNNNNDSVEYDIERITSEFEGTCGSGPVQEFILYKRPRRTNSGEEKSENYIEMNENIKSNEYETQKEINKTVNVIEIEDDDDDINSNSVKGNKS